ncbi:putative glucose-6-phosphate 1-epimerase [Porphyridium purpureum]|uniref:glucose-6-phosphate 1-epimerase n=1 Tax=Porphyridium purpureum TaxID=35688 RepID=A0A5J4YMT6_PORPP|nr:putative glucose-6-phosphate 1-epimerase [Porphyridium purpureum]|eukprot:POR2196..scf244_11
MHSCWHMPQERAVPVVAIPPVQIQRAHRLRRSGVRQQLRFGTVVEYSRRAVPCETESPGVSRGGFGELAGTALRRSDLACGRRGTLPLRDTLWERDLVRARGGGRSEQAPVQSGMAGFVGAYALARSDAAARQAWSAHADRCVPRLSRALVRPAGGRRRASAARLTMDALVGKGNGDLGKVTLSHETSNQTVEVYALGATVTSWKSGKEENFFTSKVASWDGSKPIRAGIPICWPQFGPYGPLPTHGFARNVTWKVLSTSTEADGSVSATFGLDSSNESELVKAWAGASFDAQYSVILSGEGLETTLRVKNTGDKPFSFTFSLHNYFQISDVTQTKVFGLDKLNYMDRLANEAIVFEDDDSGAGVNVTEETDRIYYGAPEELALLDTSTLRLIKMKKTPSLPDATLWNPFGGEGCDPGWKNFICVEPAAVKDPVKLAPGAEWVGGQLLGAE